MGEQSELTAGGLAVAAEGSGLRVECISLLFGDKNTFFTVYFEIRSKAFGTVVFSLSNLVDTRQEGG